MTEANYAVTILQAEYRKAVAASKHHKAARDFRRAELTETQARYEQVAREAAQLAEALHLLGVAEVVRDA